jgi:MFS family permease
MSSIEPPRAPNIPPEVVPLRARQFRLPKSFAAMRHRNYRLFLGGQLISLAGTWMQIIAQGWLVYELSRSELALGIVGFATALPVLVISPFGGVLVDRIEKRKLLILTQVGAKALSLILALLTFGGIVEVWHVVALAALLGVVNAFDGPARQAFVVDMVGKEDLPNAIALNSMTFNSARIVGPALGGAVLAAIGSAWCFLINALSGVAVVAGLLMMTLPAFESTAASVSPWQQLRGGLGYVRRNAVLRALLLAALFFSLFGISYSTVLPAFVDKVLHEGPETFGILNAASGVGAVMGAFVIAQFGDRGRRGSWLVQSMLFFPLILIAFAVNTTYWGALALALLLGTGFMVVFTLINTLLQTNLVDEMRGRVLSLYTLTYFGFTPFGNLIIGSASEFIGLSRAITISAIACLLFAAAIVATTSDLRRLP